MFPPLDRHGTSSKTAVALGKNAIPFAATQPALASDHRAFAVLGWIAIAIVFGAFGAFAAYAPLDSAAIAPGRVAAESSTKPLQHLEGGIVQEILVKEADAVKKGQVLFRLVPTQARANADMLRKQLDAALAEEARLVAEREGASSLRFHDELAARTSVPETAAAIADQERQFAERRRTLDNEAGIQRARLEQTSRELEGALRQEISVKEQIANVTAEIANVTTLFDKGLYPKNRLMALQRERARLEGQLGGQQGAIARLGEVVEQVKLEIGQTEQKFREEAGQRLTEVRARLSEIRERISVADDVVGRIEIRAPQDGIVQGIMVHAPGAIIKPGETLAELVPTGDKLVLAVRISPLDIDSVEAGQKAEVRLPAFSTRGYRTILGEVTRVSADAMLDASTQAPYYLARVEVDPATVPHEIEKKLQPGMPTEVLITTGERTMLQYLLGPVSDTIAKSMREQ